jgi:hypothetical protein
LACVIPATALLLSSAAGDDLTTAFLLQPQTIANNKTAHATQIDRLNMMALHRSLHFWTP